MKLREVNNLEWTAHTAAPEAMRSSHRTALIPWLIAAVGIALTLALWRSSAWHRPTDTAALRSLGELLAAGAIFFNIGIALLVRSLLRRHGDSIFEGGGMARADTRLDCIMAGAADGYWDWNLITGRCWYSKRVYEILDLPDDTALSLDSDLRDRIHPADVRTVAVALEQRLESLRPTSFEYRLRDGNDLYRWYRNTGCVIARDDNGSALRMSGSLEEVTDDKIRRMELEQNRDLLRRMEVIARVGGWKWDIPRDRLFWTEQIYRIHEVPMSYRPVVATAIEFYEPECRDELKAAIDAARERGIPYQLELKFRTAKGRLLWVRAQGEPIYEAGRIVGLHGTFQDITEKKAIELALRESEERYKLALEGADDGIWDWDIVSGTVVYNDRWARMLGCEPHEIEPRFESWERILHPDDREHALAVLNAYLDGKTPFYEARQRLLTKSGRWKWILTRGKIVSRGPDGAPRRMTGTNKDITYEKEIEEQLRAAHRAAEAAVRARTEFLANMSHEIRTPMTAILGFAENLADNSIDARERLNAVQTIRRNGEHLLEIINDILDISKIEAGRVIVEKIPCAPMKIANDVVELMSVRAAAKGLTLEAAAIGEIPAVVETDPTRLRQILVNIVGNAIKFTEVGSVRMEVRFDADGPAPTIRYDVIDTGIGMESKECLSLFRPFMQADATMTRRFGGTGLGLAISKRFAELLGGTIDVTSQPGKGSRFTITISAPPSQTAPAAEPVPPAIASNETVEASASLNIRVLVAEDGADNQRLISHILRKAGAVAVIVDNGREALDSVLSAQSSGIPFDVLILDMQMPIMDGYETASRLRVHGCDIPIIALTAHAMRGDRERCIAAGCNDYQSKPIRRDELILTIRRNLAGRGTQAKTCGATSDTMP